MMRKLRIVTGLGAALLLGSCSAGTPHKAEHPAPSGVTTKLSPRSAAMNYHIDNIGPVTNPVPQTPVSLTRADVSVSGWAIDEPFHKLAGNLDFAIDGVPYAAQYGVTRPDVAEYFKNSLYSNSGFQFSIAKQLLTPGSHRLTLRIISSDTRTFYETPPITVIVK